MTDRRLNLVDEEDARRILFALRRTVRRTREAPRRTNIFDEIRA